MRLVEIVYESSPVLDVCYETQREFLKGKLGNDFASLNLRELSPGVHNVVLQRFAESVRGSDNILVRGLSGIRHAAAYFQRSRVHIDVPGMAPPVLPEAVRTLLYRLGAVFTYTKDQLYLMRQCGVRNAYQFVGPCLPSIQSELPDVPTVGVLDCTDPDQDILRLRDLRKTGVRVITTANTKMAPRVESPLLLADMSTVIVSTHYAGRLHSVHDGAILSLAFNKPLVSWTADAVYENSSPFAPNARRDRRFVYTNGTNLADCVKDALSNVEALRGWQLNVNDDPLQVPTRLLEAL